MAALGLISTAAVLTGSIALSTTRTDGLAGDYAADVTGLRRALRTLEGDLRGARAVQATGAGLRLETSAGRVAFELREGVLRRESETRTEVVARHLSEFSARREGALTRVTLRLAPRARPDVPGPAVSTVVRARAGGPR
jgi:hypothetical protein